MLSMKIGLFIMHSTKEAEFTCGAEISVSYAIVSQRERERERETDRQTDRQTDRPPLRKAHQDFEKIRHVLNLVSDFDNRNPVDILTSFIW